MRAYLLLLTTLGLFSLSGCFHDQNGDEVLNEEGEISTAKSNPAAEIDHSTYQKLDPLRQYRITNKLLGTLYKGMQAKEFFDLSKGIDNLVLADDINHLDDIKQKLNTPSATYSADIAKANEKYFLRDNGMERWSPREMPLAYMYELDLSSQYFDLWMAYQLTNTILFSPAVELDSTDATDMESVFNNLFFWMQAGLSIRDIVYLHTTSEENWRRFRSPEDNTREMMEIYLMRFKDDEVPKAAIACQNWYLSDDGLGYQLIKTVYVNQEPLELLDTDDIVTCEDFYRELSEHPSLIPAITTRIVGYMMPDTDQATQAKMVDEILATNPTTFRQIFTAIIFSNRYLDNDKKIKRFEEAFFGTADRISWASRPDFFNYLTAENGASSGWQTNLSQMKQSAQRYKLGRPNEVPVDSLSFAYYHGSIRNGLLTERRTSIGTDNPYDHGWRQSFIENDDITEYDKDEFVQYLFIAVLSRKPSDKEMEVIKPIVKERSTIDTALIVLDYISRLPEFYYF